MKVKYLPSEGEKPFPIRATTDTAFFWMIDKRKGNGCIGYLFFGQSETYGLAFAADTAKGVHDLIVEYLTGDLGGEFGNLNYYDTDFDMEEFEIAVNRFKAIDEA